MSVDDKEIIMKVKSTGAVCSVPHGLVIWSTGISTLPVIRDFMEEIGQVLFNSMHFLKAFFQSVFHVLCVRFIDENDQYFPSVIMLVPICI